MIWLALLLFGIGVCGSAFFSGTETAFYRASRVKLVIKALEHDRLSKFLAWLTNHPAFLVGTLLIGNNIANYLVSFGIVVFVTTWFLNSGPYTEIFATLLMTPFLFVFGESLPKTLCYQAPNRMLRAGAIPLLLFSIILAPFSGVLWALSRVLERLVGQSPERLRLALARQELQGVIAEGQEAGVLHGSQRQLSQNFFLVASKQVRQVCTPINRVPTINQETDLATAIKLGQRYTMPDLPISKGDKRKIVGYVHLVELLVLQGRQKELPSPRPMIEILGTEPFAEALLRMQTQRENLAKVVDSDGQVLGLLSIDQLTSQLLRGPLESLRR
ncbi:MAG: CNNM domain-containing protein [Pirellulaceae bacterium]